MQGKEVAVEASVFGLDGAAGLPPVAKEGDLLVMENAEGNLADSEGLFHAGTAGVEVATEEVVNHGTSFIVLGQDESQEFFAQFDVGAERGVLLHRFLVCGCEGGFDVGEDVAEEVEVGEVFLDVLIGLRADGFESGADTEPAGEVEAGLGPGEDPGDGAEVFEGGFFAGASGGARSEDAGFEGVDGRYGAVEVDEAIGIEQAAVGLV